MSSPIVSIIVPAFNAASSIAKTFDSILKQTYSFIEIVVINDCSVDNTLTILSQYEDVFKARGFGYKLLNHTVNGGVAAARNTGLQHCTGDYIYYVDADDYITPDCIDKLILNSANGEVDIVGCNWILQFKTQGREMKQPKVNSNMHAIELMAKGVMRWNLWLFLVKRNLYVKNNIRFINGLNMGEDMMVMFKLIYKAESVAFIDDPLYYYDKSNDNSLTNIYSVSHKEEVTKNIVELDNFFSNNLQDINWKEWSNFLKLNIKLPLLISNHYSDYREWKNWFEYSNRYVLKNDRISTKIKILQYMAVKGQYWFVYLYYLLVVKLVYGVIYK